MRMKIAHWASLSLVFTLMACGAKGEPQPVPPAAPPPSAVTASPDVTAVIAGTNAFGLDLYARLRSTQGNLFFSPYSLSTALAMTYAGARGQTEAQMAQVLHLALGQQRVHPAESAMARQLNSGGKSAGYEMTVANALWPQIGFELSKDFMSVMDANYGPNLLNPVDYQKAADAARDAINAWVEKATKEKIKDLIQPGILTARTRLVLTNAIYFKGKWETQFDKEMTQDLPFKIALGQEVPVPMMSQKATFGYAEDATLQVLDLPYRGKDLSMTVLLPRAADGLPALEQSVNGATLNRWLGALSQQEVQVFLPKFKITSQFSLADTLAAMGMTDAFSMQAADFSGMTGKKDLFLSAVVLKAYVDTNEEGTEAAAATGAVMALKAMPAPVPVFRADHPFLFLIRDNRTKAILFMGRVADPRG